LNELLDRKAITVGETAVSKMTVGRFTFGAWLDKGIRFDGGRVIYHTARKYWLRVGSLIVSVEIADKDRIAV